MESLYEKSKPRNKKDDHFEKCIEEFAEVIVEDSKEQYRSDLEPFELYAARVKSKVHANMEEFRSRFAKGYHILLDELQKESKKEEPPKPGSIRP